MLSLLQQNYFTPKWKCHMPKTLLLKFLNICISNHYNIIKLVIISWFGTHLSYTWCRARKTHHIKLFSCYRTSENRGYPYVHLHTSTTLRIFLRSIVWKLILQCFVCGLKRMINFLFKNATFQATEKNI